MKVFVHDQRTKERLEEKYGKKAEKKEMSDKADRFKRVVTIRVNQVLVGLERLGKCSRRASYEYSEEEVAKIFGAISGATEKAIAAFKPAVEEKTAKGFSL